MTEDNKVRLNPEVEAERIYFATYMLRSEILRSASRESCILSTRLVGDMLREMGYRVLPIVANVEILNAPAMHEYTKGQFGSPMDATAEDPAAEPQGLAIKYLPEDNDKIGTDEDDGLFYGHVLLTCVGRETQYLVDPSIDQASRPMWGINLPPLLIPFDRGEVGYEQFLDGQRVLVPGPNGVGVFYEAHIEDTTYTNAGDWNNPDPENDETAADLIGRVLGLVQVGDDFGEFPPLPELSTTISSSAWTILQEAPSLKEAERVLRERGHDLEDVVGELAVIGERLSGGG